MPNVRMPDGAVVNFPDDMTPEDIKTKISSKFPDLAPADGLNALGKALSYGADLGENISGRLQMGGGGVAQTLGEIGPYMRLVDPAIAAHEMLSPGSTDELIAPRKFEVDLREVGEELYAKGELRSNEARRRHADTLANNLAFDVTGALAESLPALGVGLATGKTSLGLAAFAPPVWGQSYGRARKEGKGPMEAAYEARFRTAAEVGTETLPLKWAIGPGKDFMKRVLDVTVGEGAQEAFSSFLNTGWDEGVFNGDTPLSKAMSDWLFSSDTYTMAAYEGLVGTIAGAGMGAIAHPFTPSKEKQIGQALDTLVAEATPEQIEYNMALIGLGPQQDIDAGPKKPGAPSFPSPQMEAGFTQFQLQNDMFTDTTIDAGTLVYAPEEDFDENEEPILGYDPTVDLAEVKADLDSLAPIMKDVEKTQSFDMLRFEVMKAVKGISEPTPQSVVDALPNIQKVMDDFQLGDRIAKSNEYEFEVTFPMWTQTFGTQEAHAYYTLQRSHQSSEEIDILRGRIRELNDEFNDLWRSPNESGLSRNLTKRQQLLDQNRAKKRVIEDKIDRLWAAGDETWRLWRQADEADGTIQIAEFPTRVQGVLFAHMAEAAKASKQPAGQKTDAYKIRREEAIKGLEGQEAEIAGENHRRAVKKQIFGKGPAVLAKSLTSILGGAPGMGVMGVSPKVLGDYPDLITEAVTVAERELTRTKNIKGLGILQKNFPHEFARITPMMTVEVGEDTADWAKTTWLASIDLDVTPALQIKRPTRKASRQVVDTTAPFQRDGHSRHVERRYPLDAYGTSYAVESPNISEAQVIADSFLMLSDIGLNPNAYMFTLDGIHTINGLMELHGLHMSSWTRESRDQERQNTFHLAINDQIVSTMKEASAWDDSAQRSAFLATVAHELGHHVDRNVRGDTKGDMMSEHSPLFDITIDESGVTFGDVLAEAVDAYMKDTLGLTKFFGYPLNSLAAAVSAVRQLAIQSTPATEKQVADAIAQLRNIKVEAFAQIHALFYMYYTTAENAAKLDEAFPKAMAMMKEVNNAHYLPTSEQREDVAHRAILGEISSPAPDVGLPGLGAEGYRAISPRSYLQWQARTGMGERDTGAGDSILSYQITGTRASYSSSRLRDLLAEYAYPDGRVAAAVATINPGDFISATTGNKDDADGIRATTGPLDEAAIKAEQQSPFLEIEKTKDGYRIAGHEGRHRMHALSEAGVTSAPVVLRLSWSGYNVNESGLPESGALAGQQYSHAGENNFELQFSNPVDITYENKSELRKNYGTSVNDRISFQIVNQRRGSKYQGDAFRAPGFEGGAESGVTAADVIEEEIGRGKEINRSVIDKYDLNNVEADRLKWVGRSKEALVREYGPIPEQGYDGLLTEGEIEDVTDKMPGSIVLYEDVDDGVLVLLPEDTRIDFQLAPTVSTVPILTGTESATVQTTGRQPSIADVGKHLESRVSDRIDPASYSMRVQKDPANEAALQKIRDQMVATILEEAHFSLTIDPDSATWYDYQVKVAKGLIGKYKHPEILTDPNMDMVFTSILSITSNGQDVIDNFAIADRLYSIWKDTGSLPKDLGHSRPADVRNKLGMLFTLIDRHGYDWVRDFLVKPIEAGDLSKFVQKEFPRYNDKGKLKPFSTGEVVDEMLTGSALFGPKLGSFYANLQGDFSRLTMDLWFARTWNRITGHLVKTDKDPQTDIARRNRIRKAIAEGNADLNLTSNSDPIPFDLGEVYNDDRVMDEYVEYVDKIIQHEWNKQWMERRGFKPRKSGQETEFEQAIKALSKANQDALVAAPRNGAERRFMRQVINQAVDQLNSEGTTTSPASLQAILWYYEKHLYDVLRGKANESDTARYEDYVAGAIGTIGWENLDESDQGELARYNARGRSGEGTERILASLHEPTPEEVEIANRTSRSRGAVGKNAIVPRYVTETVKPGDSILDFGAGKDAAHAKTLRDAGLNVTAHEFGANQNANHDPNALTRTYDIVYASNVLNVQSSMSMLETTLQKIATTTSDNGRAIFNYPASPRKADIDPDVMRQTIKKFFKSVRRVGGSNSAPLWEATGPKRTGLGTLHSNPLTAMYRFYQTDVAEQAITWGENLLSPITALGKVPTRRLYMEKRQRFLGKMARVEEVSKKLSDTFAKLNEDEAQAVFNYLTDPTGDVNSIPDVSIKLHERGAKRNISIRDRSVSLKRMFNQIGNALVDEGLIPQESREKFRDMYLPRLYLKHVIDGMPGTLGARLSKGNQYKHRTDIPKEWRRVMGEITDPGYLAAVGVSIPLRDLEIIKFLRDISQHRDWVIPNYLVPIKTSTDTGQVRATLGGIGDKAVSVFWLETEADRLRKQASYMTGQAEAETLRYAQDLQELFDQIQPTLRTPNQKEYQQVPNTRQYGALRGMYLHKQIYEDIFPGKETDGYTRMEAITRAWKVMKVPMNYPTVVRNLVSNMILMNMGGTPAHRVIPSLIKALHEMRTNGKHYRVARMGGITQSTFAHNELYELEKDFIKLMAKNDITLDEGLPVWKLKAWGADVVARHTNFYQGSEQVFKTALIIDAMENQGMDEMDAILAANEALFDYSLLPGWAKKVRKNILGIPFLTFYYKAAGQTPRAFLRRPHLVAGYMTLWAIMREISQYAMDIDDDDWEAILASLPRWLQEKGHAWIIPMKDEHGRWQALDVGYILPWAAHAQTLRNVLEGKPLEAFEEMGFLGTPIANLTSAILTRKDPFTQQEIWNPNDPAKLQFGNFMNYMWRMAAPTYMTDIGFLGHMRRALTDQKDVRRAYYGQPTSTVLQAMLRLPGINLYPMDQESSRNANLLRYRYEINDHKQRMRQRLKPLALKEGPGVDEERQEIVNFHHNKILEISAEMAEYSEKSDLSHLER